MAGPPTAHVVPIGQNLAVLDWGLMTFDGRRRGRSAVRKPAPIEIAVLGDSDDTRTQSTGAIADIRFAAQCEPPAP